MRSVDESLYAARITVIDRAISLVANQMEVDATLAAEYDKTIKMLEIEQELGATSKELPDAAGLAMMGKVDELRLMEEQNADLRIRFAADDEVAKLIGQI